METNPLFLEMAIDDLIKILEDNYLNIDEPSVWTASVVWIKHDENERLQHLKRLVSCIRLGLHDDEAFYQLCSHPYIINDIACLELIQKATSCRGNYCNPTGDCYINAITTPRYPSELMFVVGDGNRGSNKITIQVYDHKADVWSMVPDCFLEGSRSFHRSAVIGTHLYIIGGIDGVKCLSSCYRFDAIQKCWDEVAPMNEIRCYVSTAAIGNCIYVFGGEDETRQQLHSAEVYDSKLNQVIDNKIYIGGGFYGINSTDKMECYSFKDGQWHSVSPMIQRSEGMASGRFVQLPNAEEYLNKSRNINHYRHSHLVELSLL